ncbi:RES family NAD+ phosphorylase [Mycetocola sp. BIGb0189]|uniref:RES family NAD+ phosphorylase n=1 Tax=Mycetocola sp. BIGb0189 TaxID=2940604 RepID=UPI0037C7E41A
MYRAHAVTRSAWWFDSGPHGRFNLQPPRGTCYVATRIETAVRERVRGEIHRSGFVSSEFARSFRISALTAPTRYSCASVSSSRAARYRLVRELVTLANYDLPREWARSFADAGFTGVFYGSAFTTGSPTALGLFGSAGGRASEEFTEQHCLSGTQAGALSGLSVAPVPASARLKLIEEPRP